MGRAGRRGLRQRQLRLRGPLRGGGGEELGATAAKQGVVLEWRREAVSGETVELDRTTVSVSGTAAAASQRRDALPGAGKEPAESHFRAGEAAGAMDAGGTVDRTAEIGATYRYTGQPGRSVAVGRQKPASVG